MPARAPLWRRLGGRCDSLAAARLAEALYPRSPIMAPNDATRRDRASKACACTGVRWCARCRAPDVRELHRMDDPFPIPELLANRPALTSASESAHPLIHVFDPRTQKARGCPEFEGLHIWPEFLDPDEANALLEEIERQPFVPAQSGKLKQHYGPKINFNKRKMNAAKFAGIPEYARTLEARLRERIESDRTRGIMLPARCEEALDAYETTDVFVLRYRDEWMSNLDFHCDDPFGYGEGIIDVSLESDSVLSFLAGDAPTGDLRCVRASLPARSAAFLYGPARFDWEHAILAYDIEGQRTSITLRTLGDALRATEGGQTVIERAREKQVSRRSPRNPVV